MLLFLLALPVIAQFDPSCFITDSETYGVKKGMPVSDAGSLRSDAFTAKAKIHQIKVCGIGALTGIQLTLLNDYEQANSATQSLTQLGTLTSSCDTWTVPKYEYVTQVQVATKPLGEVVYLQVTMSDGKQYRKGVKSTTSFSTFEDFTEQSMFIGVKGNENPDIAAIGFLRYTCMPPINNPDKPKPTPPPTDPS